MKLARYSLPVTRDDLKLWKYKNKHRRQRIFIIGNGPSLRVEDLNMLIGHTTFGCNKIYLAFAETQWRPTYYCVEDYLVLRQNRTTLDKLDGFPKFFPRHFLGWSPRVNKSIYFHQIGKEFFPSFPGFSTCPVSGLFWGSTVVYSMMQMAAFMGASEICLLGVDFSFDTAGDDYDAQHNEFISRNESNHFLQGYRAPGERWNPPNLHMQALSFQCAAAWTGRSGIPIINCTRGGKLELFPRASLEDLVKQ